MNNMEATDLNMFHNFRSLILDPPPLSVNRVGYSDKAFHPLKHFQEDVFCY